jgi:hypothetical protein
MRVSGLFLLGAFLAACGVSWGKDAVPSPSAQPAARPPEPASTGRPSMQLLEFLGQFPAGNGKCMNPEDLERMRLPQQVKSHDAPNDQ